MNNTSDLSMSDPARSSTFHSNRYAADSACEHCEGIIRHEPWCITLDPTVYYAYQIVVEPDKLTPGDALVLHALGVTWEPKKCAGNCQTSDRTN